jgi:hypothetical protein
MSFPMKEATNTSYVDSASRRRFREKWPQNTNCSRGGYGLNVADEGGMSFTAIADRVRSEFVEMPGMQLTLSQATRLWNLGADDCRNVLDFLVDTGFLMWTPQRTVIRTGRPAHVVELAIMSNPDGSVLASGELDNSVAR